MGKRSTARFSNGVISAFIVAFFLLHGALGALSVFFGFSSPATWIIWCGVAVVGLHVVVSVVTSREQLTDRERPPSSRKKRHLVLKWVTGSLLALAAGAHIATMRLYGAQAVQASTSGAAIMVVLAVALAVHLCVGSKSLLTDLGMDKCFKVAFRVIVCVFAALFAVSAIAGALI